MAWGSSGSPSRLESKAQRSEETAGLRCQLPGAPHCDCPVWARCGPGPAPGPSWEDPVGGRRPLGGEAVHVPAGIQRLGHGEPGAQEPWARPLAAALCDSERPLTLTLLKTRTREELRDRQAVGTVPPPWPWTGGCQSLGKVTAQGALPPPPAP